MSLKRWFQASFAAAIGVYLLLALPPLEGWLATVAGASPSPRADMDLARAGFLLAALGSAAYLAAASRARVDSLDRLLFHVLIGVLILDASFLGIQLAKHLTHVIPDTPSEHNIYLSAAQGGSIFTMHARSKLEHPPFLLSTYPPVFYLAQKILFGLVGPSTLAGRYVSAGALLWLAVLLARVPRGGSVPLEWLVSPLLFFSVLWQLAWFGSLAHPEFLAATLSMGGLLVYLRRGLPEGRRWVLGASLLCALALLTKPTMVAAPAAVVLHLLWDRRYPECARFAAAVLLWFLGSYAALWWPTEGGIWLMTIAGHAISLSPANVARFLRDRMTNPFVVVALVASVLLLLTRRESRDARTAVALFFLVGLASLAVFAGRPGAGFHYFLQPAIGGCLVIGLLLSGYAANERWWGFRLLVVLLIALLLGRVRPQVRAAVRVPPPGFPYPDVPEILGRLETGPDEYILSDPNYSVAVARAGHRPILNDSHAYTLMVDNGIVSAGPLMDVLRGARVPYLLLIDTPERKAEAPYGGRLWPLEVAAHLAANYGCTVIREPGDPPGLVLCERLDRAGARSW
jgi:hypothetical protein